MKCIIWQGHFIWDYLDLVNKKMKWKRRIYDDKRMKSRGVKNFRIHIQKVIYSNLAIQFHLRNDLILTFSS